MLKDDIEKLKAAMDEALRANLRVGAALTPTTRRLGVELAREVLADFAIILENGDGVNRVRNDYAMIVGEGF